MNYLGIMSLVGVSRGSGWKAKSQNVVAPGTCGLLGGGDLYINYRAKTVWKKLVAFLTSAHSSKTARKPPSRTRRSLRRIQKEGVF